MLNEQNICSRSSVAASEQFLLFDLCWSSHVKRALFTLASSLFGKIRGWILSPLTIWCSSMTRVIPLLSALLHSVHVNSSIEFCSRWFNESITFSFSPMLSFTVLISLLLSYYCLYGPHPSTRRWCWCWWWSLEPWMIVICRIRMACEESKWHL